MKINTNRLNIIRYSLYAPAYNWAASILNGSRKKSISMLNVKEGETVLIVGAGTGLDLDYLPKGALITAGDITPSMVNRMNERNKTIGHQLISKHIDGHKLEFHNNSYDKIILHLILAVIPNPIQCISEAERVLKPGGRIVVFDKFIAKNKKASLIRKFFNIFTNLFFSNITRSFENILSVTKLKVVADVPANLGGTFRIILLEKTFNL